MSFTPPIPTSRGIDLDKREIHIAVDALGKGRSNANGSFTLTENVTSTVVTDENVSSTSAVVPFPTTANAAAEIGNGTMYISSQADGSFTVTHANNAQTNRTFNYVIQG